ncbi:MAG TPA: TlpA disulfide reductase family protein [Candidatus Elarobacter sp.]
MSLLRPAVLCAALALLGARHHPPPTIFDLGDAVGARPPELTLTATDGTPIAFRALAGKPTFVFLFAQWCHPCKLAEPLVLRDYARYGDRVRFIGVDVLDDAKKARDAVAAAKYPFPVIVFGEAELDKIISEDERAGRGHKYEVPTDYLLDAEGRVRTISHGLAVNEHGDPVDVLPSDLEKLGIP